MLAEYVPSLYDAVVEAVVELIVFVDDVEPASDALAVASDEVDEEGVTD